MFFETEYMPGELRGITYLTYSQYFQPGDILSRRDVAERVGVSYSNAVYHLERCVSDGILHKQRGFIGRQPGWVYALPETLPRLEGL
jgi:Fic family protein